MKKNLSVLLILFCVGMAFANEPGSSSSKTSESTQGLFKTDVDNYMSLNSWDTIKPDSLFTFVGYDTSKGGINLGLAHQFKNLYLGYYFAGTFDSFVVNKKVVDDIEYGTKTTTDTKESDGDGSFDTALLFGFGNMAIKGSLNVEITKDSKEKEDTNPVHIANDQEFSVTPMIDFAMKSKLNDWNAVYAADLGVGVNVNKEFATAGGKDIFTDNSFTVLYLGAGIGLDKSTKKVTHDISVDMENKIYIYPSKQSNSDGNTLVTQKGKSGYDLIITPAYQLTYPASDKLMIKLGANSPISLATTGTAKEFTYAGVHQFNSSYKSTFEFETQASLSFAMTYQWKPALALNVGVGIQGPKFGIKGDKTKAINSTTGALTSTTSNTGFFVEASDSYCSWSSGFTLKPAKNVVIDGSYKILANLFGNDFESDFVEGTGTNILNNLNKAIVHNIAIEVSVKF